MPLFSLLLFAALAGGSSPGDTPLTTPSPAVSEPAKASKPKKICIEEAQLGSLFAKRICATQEEWDRRRERDAAEMEKKLSVPTPQ